MELDPVCGTEINPTQAVHAEHHGKRYAFCSLHCKQAFEDDPQAYAAQAAQPNRSVTALNGVAQTLTTVYVTESSTRVA